MTDADGSVALPQHARGAVVCAWTDDASGVAMLGSRLVSPGRQEADERTRVVTLHPAASTTVEVTDPAGRAIEGASVFAWVRASGFDYESYEFASSRAGTPAGTRPIASFAARTDARGMCRVPPLPTGEIDVSGDWLIDPPSADAVVFVEAVGYRSERRPLTGGAMRVELVPVVEVRALVTDTAGEPIPGCEWWISPGDRGFGDAAGRVLALVPRGLASPVLRLDADGFVARTFAVEPDGPRDADLGTVVLERAWMLRGTVVWPDGTPAAPVLVTATGPGGKFVQGLTNAAGRFVLEPPCEGAFGISAGTPVGEMRGSGRAQIWEASARDVRAESEVRLELRFVPAVLVELDGPEPRPPGFHWSNVVVVARSADGRADYDWMPEDGWTGRRRVVRLYGRGPWTLVARHAALVTAEVELGTPVLGPTDPLPTHRIELRPSPDPATVGEQR